MSRYRNNTWNQKNQNEGSYNRFINKIDVKKKIIDHIYNTINVTKYKYTILENEGQLSLLNKNKYHVSFNYCGTDSLLIFMKIRDRQYSVLVEKKSLTYSRENFNLSKARITSVRLRVSKDMYHGSIFDGIFLNKRSGERVFIINDIHQMHGIKLDGDKLNNKIINITAFLSANMTQDNVLNNIQLIVNAIYDPKDSRKLVNDYCKKDPLSEYIKGLLYLPDTDGNKLIYLYKTDRSLNINNMAVNTTTSKPVSSIVSQNQEKETETKTKYTNVNLNVDLDEDLVLVFKMKKTPTPDVYKLYLIDKVKDESGSKIKNIKIDIALVPTIECSHFCSSLFENDEMSTLVRCKYLNDKQRWIPIGKELIQKKPDKLKKLTKRQ